MIWVAGGSTGLWQITADQRRQWPSPPCPCRLARAGKQVLCACAGGEIWDLTCQRQLAHCPGVERMAISPCGRYVYLLSGEADSLCCCRARDGQLLYAHPAGVWPQDLRLDPTGRYAVVAGGAAGEALVFAAPELRLLRRYPLPGAVCQAMLLPQSLAVLLAVEEGQILTALGEVDERGYREWGRWRGLPGMLCQEAANRLLVGSLDQLALFDWQKRACLWRQHRPGLPIHGQAHPRGILLSDSLTGCVSLWNREETTLFYGENVFAVHNDGANGLY